MYLPFCLKIHSLPLTCPTSSPPQNNYCITLMLPRSILPCAPKHAQEALKCTQTEATKANKTRDIFRAILLENTTFFSSLTWWAREAKPKPSCLHTTMASFIPQFSLQIVPQRFLPPTSMSTSTRPSARSLPPASRTWNTNTLTDIKTKHTVPSRSISTLLDLNSHLKMSKCHGIC